LQEVASLRQELADVKAALEAGQDGAQGLSTALAASRREAEALRAADRTKDETIARLQKQVADADQRKALAPVISDATQRAAGGRAPMTVTNDDEVKALTDTLSVASAENDRLKQTLAAESHSSEQLKSQVVAAEQVISELKRELAARDQTIADQTSTLAFRNRDLEASRLSVERMETELAGIRSNRAIWAAAALDPRSGIIYTLPNQTDAEGARKGAMSICRERGSDQCELLHEFSDMCISVARINGQRARPNNFGWAVGRTPQAAETVAVRDCEDRQGQACTKSYTICSPDNLSGLMQE
jgi:DNA repair exonuclease SbcCD ATPase subunit